MQPRKSRRLAAAATVAIASSLVPGAAAPATAAGDPAPDRTVSVRLITGDALTVATDTTGRRSVAVDASSPRANVGLRAWTEGDRFYVIPSDALPLVESGRVDRRLFEIGALAEQDSDSTRVLVSRVPGVAALSAVAGANLTRELPVVGLTAATVPDGTAFWPGFLSGASGVDRLLLDGKRHVDLDRSVRQIGAPTAWEAGYTGKGVTVAVLDSGVDLTHPDLRDKVTEARDFTGTDNTDKVGHGTHVASIIAGTGAGAAGKYRGVAPDATLVSGKVCASISCDESAILAGMEWAAGKARVINMSLGGPDTPGADPLEEAVGTLTERTGALFVAAAGNNGTSGLNSPATADAALAVGSVDREDQVASSSSRGPRLDGAVKPEITAPGVGIVAARATGTKLGKPVGTGYVAASGTSMATPHVAGAAAILAQRHPDWRPADLKSALTASAKPTEGTSVFDQGAGRVDVPAALARTVLPQSTLDLGLALWPHNDDPQVVKKVTVRNAGTTETKAAITVTATGPSGARPPDGMFTVSPTELTLPPGGSAEATVTVNSTLGGADGTYMGAVTATAAGIASRTVLAFEKEVESYDVPIRAVGEDGADAPTWTALISSTHRKFYNAGPTRAALRLPKGEYGGYADIRRIVDGKDHSTLVPMPKFTVTGATPVVFDATRARPVTVRADRPDARIISSLLSYSLRVDPDYGHAIMFLLPAAQLRVAPAPDVTPRTRSVLMLSAAFARAGPAGDFGRSPYSINLVDTQYGAIRAGIDVTARTTDMAHATLKVNAPGVTTPGARLRAPLPDGVGLTGSFGWKSPLPLARVDHITPNIPWTVQDVQFDAKDTIVAADRAPNQTYQSGKQYREQGLAAVIGLSTAQATASRYDDETMYFDIPSYAAGQNHTGTADVDTSTTILYENGKEIARSTNNGTNLTADPTQESATYRLDTTLTRSTFTAHNTRIDASWTFPSHRPTDGQTTKATLLTTTYSPTTDNHNRVPPGPTPLPFRVERPRNTPTTPLTTYALQASYDDGKTWHPLPLTRDGDTGTATMDIPPTATYVSLRAEAKDEAGNAVTQTAIRAIGVQPR